MPDSAALRDHAAVVTGAGSGLGAAVACRLGGEGAHVTVNDLPAEAAAVAELVGCLVCDTTCSFGEIRPISGGWSA